VKDALFYIYIGMLFWAISAGLYKYSAMDTKGRMILVLTGTALVTEVIAFILSKSNKIQTPPYHFYSAIEIIMVTWYFFMTIKVKRQRLFLPLSLSFWIVICMLNTLLLQPLDKLNSNILLVESFSIIAMSLIALYRILEDTFVINILVYPHFWIWSCLLIYWSCTFFFWAYIKLFAKSNMPYLNEIQYFQGVVNIIIYWGIGCSFLLYHKSRTV
jgi:hypothetical protein